MLPHVMVDAKDLPTATAGKAIQSNAKQRNAATTAAITAAVPTGPTVSFGTAISCTSRALHTIIVAMHCNRWGH